MNSELYDFSQYIFGDKNSLHYLVSNLSFSITFNQPCRDIFLIGDFTNIQNLIELLRLFLREKISTYKEYLKSDVKDLRYTKFIIFERDDPLKILDRYGRIVIEHLTNLYYLSDFETILKIKDTRLDFDIKIVSKEFDILLSKYINYSIRTQIPFMYNVVNTKENMYCLYNNFLNDNLYLINEDITLEHLYHKICIWCNRNFCLSQVKEYLIDTLGNPDYFQGYKKTKSI